MKRYTLFVVANGLHRNFYEGQMNRESLEIAIRNIEKLIEKFRRIPDAIATAAYMVRVLDTFLLEYLKRTAKESFFFATN